MLFRQRQASWSWMAALLPAACACVYVSGSILSLRRAIAETDLAEQIRTVKRAARKVPLWVTVVAWSTLGAAYAFYRLSASIY
jgi:hypothetical protein